MQVLKGHSRPRGYVCVLVLSLAGWCWLSPSAWSAETSSRTSAVPGPALNVASLKSFRATTPSTALPIARAMQRAAEIFDARAVLQQRVQDLRIERDNLKTELTGLDGELRTAEEHSRKLLAQASQTERRKAEELGAQRRTLEAQMKDQLLEAGRQITQELERDARQELQVLETRQREAMSRGPDRELDEQMRELDQLEQELAVQTREMSARLARLQASPEVSRSLERSMRQTVERRRQELTARRKQLEAEREATFLAERRTLLEQLKQQQGSEQHRRMTVKEAALRQSMAETLQRTQTQAEGEIAYLRQGAEKLGKRQHELAERQTQLAPRLQTVERELASADDQSPGLVGEWSQALTQMELALQQTDLEAHPEVGDWYQQTLKYLDASLAAELNPLSQRALAKMRQQRQLAEQQRRLREQQLALQLANEMEQQRHEKHIARQREREELEQMFTRAMKVFEQGHYEDAIKLFEQVIVKEGDLEDPAQMVAGGRTVR